METGHLKPELNGMMHDLVRGYKGKNFWLMETQPGFVNWAATNRTLDRGVVREMAWQAIAHGADAILYWQWRSALNGQEQYHGTLVGADGTPMPVYSEIKQLGEELDHIGSALAGTTIHASVALLNSYDSQWAIDFQRHSSGFSYAQLMTDWYAAIKPLATNIDVVSPDAPLDAYKIVFAPALNILPEATAQHLRDYVQHGGTLVLGPRSGMKDIDDAFTSCASTRASRRSARRPCGAVLRPRPTCRYQRRDHLRQGHNMGGDAQHSCVGHESPPAIRQFKRLARRSTCSHHPARWQGTYYICRRMARPASYQKLVQYLNHPG